jgi:hypothetical protein
MPGTKARRPAPRPCEHGGTTLSIGAYDLGASIAAGVRLSKIGFLRPCLTCPFRIGRKLDPGGLATRREPYLLVTHPQVQPPRHSGTNPFELSLAICLPKPLFSRAFALKQIRDAGA